MAVQKNRNEQTPPNNAMADAMRTAGLNPQASQSAPQAEQPQVQPQAQQSQQQSFAQAGANVNQPSSRVGSRGRSVLDINANHRRPVGRNMAGEDVSVIFQGLKDRIAKTMNEQQKADFRLLVLDNNATPVTYSSILVCYKEAVGGQNHIAVYSLMIESSGSPLESSTLNLNGAQVEVDVVAGDIYLHKSYWSVLEKFVIDSYGINALVHDGGCVIVNSETEDFTETRFNRLLHNATQAVYTIMDNKLGSVEEPFTLGEVGANDQMIARVDFTRQHEENIVGLPVRGDIIVGMSAQTQTDAQFGLQQSRQLTRVTAYVDLMYQPAAAGFQQAPQMGNMFQQQQPMATQMYQPRLVMTTIDTMTDAVTMELQLLALSTALGLNRNMHWSGTFRTHKGKGNDVDLKDLGALGYEINLTGDPQAKPDRLDTRSAEFGDNEMRQLINMLIAPKLIYTLDIEEAGELSWIHQTFIAAANGNEDARMAILQAANNLTMGHFQNLFNAAAPVCYDDQDRIHLGYYYDREGNRRDLRELDYVAILNLAGKTNPKLVEAWEDTHRNTNIALEVRLDQRKAILRQLISGDIVIKGFARRVSFDNTFLDALSEAIVKSGLNVRPAKGLDDNAGQVQRGGYALDHLVVNQNVGNFFNYGTATQQNSRLFSSPFTGNWGRN
jgi:hypothetical protein